MPGSFLSRHRTVCEVLHLIRNRHKDDARTIALCDEAIRYCRRMSIRLTEYKLEKKDETIR